MPRITAAHRAWMARDDALRPDAPIVHLLHIGKTGGTSLLHLLMNLSDIQRQQLGYRVRVHEHDYALARVPDGEHCVFFVRDPLAIAMSGFYSRQRMGRPQYDIPHRPDEARVFGRFATFTALADALADPEHRDHALAREAFEVVSHMRRVLTAYLGTADDFARHAHKVLYVGDFDRFGESCAEMLRRLGLRDLPDVPHLHRNRPRPDALDARHRAALDEILAPHRAVYAAALRHVKAVGGR